MKKISCILVLLLAFSSRVFPADIGDGDYKWKVIGVAEIYLHNIPKCPIDLRHRNELMDQAQEDAKSDAKKKCRWGDNVSRISEWNTTESCNWQYGVDYAISASATFQCEFNP